MLQQFLEQTIPSIVTDFMTEQTGTNQIAFALHDLTHFLKLLYTEDQGKQH